MSAPPFALRHFPRALFALFIMDGAHQPTFAVETCGVPTKQFEDGYEAGALPVYRPPADNTPLSVAIARPANAEIVGVPRIQIVGTLSAPVNTGIVVGGKVAAIAGTTFVSRTVWLDPGPNTIRAELFTVDGAGPSTSRAVIYDPATEPAVWIEASQSHAMVPFRSRFYLNRNSSDARQIMRARLDFNGDGTVDIDTADTTALEYLFQTPGEYNVRGTITLDDTDPNTPPVDVQVASTVLGIHPRQIVIEACQAFGTLRERLTRQVVTGAARVLAPNLQPGFTTLWTSLGSRPPTIAPLLGTIVDATYSMDIAELLIARPITGQVGTSRAYRVQVVRDDHGVWRIEQM